uniref:Uncharacterized protein n=1 Tax=Zosterops lateralis melanops TaxID=1220523 RepID=A0A8D2PLH1_ZOSLA
MVFILAVLRQHLGYTERTWGALAAFGVSCSTQGALTELGVPWQLQVPVRMQDTVRMDVPVRMQDTVRMDVPVRMQDTVRMQDPVGMQVPVKLQDPVMMQDPVRMQDPVTMQDPVRLQVSVRMQDPVRMQNPVGMQVPVMTQDSMRMPCGDGCPGEAGCPGVKSEHEALTARCDWAVSQALHYSPQSSLKL